MNKYIFKIKKDFNNTPDLKIKNIKIGINSIYIIYIETICDSNKINDYILKNLTRYDINKNLNSNIPGPNTVILDNYNFIEKYLTSGFTIVIYRENIIAIEKTAMSSVKKTET